MRIGHRIAQARKELRLSQQAVGNRFGISRAAVAQWEAGDTNPGTAKLEGLADVLGVRLEWLAIGKGPMRPGDPDSPAHWDGQTAPVIDFVQAGHWSEISDPYPPGVGLEMIATDLPLGPRSFALIVEGESMVPGFSPGDKIVFDPDLQPRPGDFVVAKLDGEEKATFKKYRPRGQDRGGNDVIELVPLNDDWPTLTIDAANPGGIVATMVEHRRYRQP